MKIKKVTSLIFNELITVVMISEVCNLFCWSDTMIVDSNYNLGHGHLYAFVCVYVLSSVVCVCVCVCARACLRTHVHACVPNISSRSDCQTPRKLEAMGSMSLVWYIEEGEHDMTVSN